MPGNEKGNEQQDMFFNVCPAAEPCHAQEHKAHYQIVDKSHDRRKSAWLIGELGYEPSQYCPIINKEGETADK
jgi:hypothetical protein